MIKKFSFRKYGSVSSLFIFLLILNYAIPAVNGALPVGGNVKNQADAKSTLITLDNGMEFVLMENHSNPMIASIIVVKTGSKNENVGNNGVSHMLEHLLFNGTKNRTQEQIYDEMDFYGGYNNAHTTKDYTNFMILMPAEHIDKGLDIQADMLLNSTIPAEKLEKERGIVIEEISRDVDRELNINRLFFERKLYEGNSYALPVLGTVNTVTDMAREDIVSYYKEHYVPNNMIGLIIGGFETGEMVKKLKKYFGCHSPRKVPLDEPVDMVSLKEGGVYHVHGAVTKKFLSMGIKAPTLDDPDFFPFTILNTYLNDSGILRPGSSNNKKDKTDTDSIFPDNSQFYSEYVSNKEFGVLNLFTGLPGDVDGNDAIQAVIENLKGISGEINISEDELQGIKTQLKTEEFFLKERMHYYGMSKAHILANKGYEFFESYIDNFENVAVKDIKRVAKAYLSLDTTLFFRRTGKTETVNYVATIVEPFKDNENKFVLEGYHAPVNETGHSMRSDGSGNTKKEILPNGLTLITTESSDSRVFAVHLLFKDRLFHEPEDKTGIADFLHRILLKGTTTRDGDELNRKFNSLGVRLSLYDDPYMPYDNYRTSTQYSFIRLETIDDYYDESLNLIADVIKNPGFNQTKIDEVKSEMVRIVQGENGRAYETAKRLFFENLFPDTTLASNVSGEIKTVSSINRADLVKFHKKYFSPANMIINVVSNISNQIISRKVTELFGGLETYPGLVEPPQIIANAIAGIKPVTVKKGKEQSYVYFGYTIPHVEEKDEAPIVILSSILSNDMAFRLREQQGLAYSLGCSIQTLGNIGWFQSHMGTRKKNIEQVKNGILKIVSEYQTKEFKQNDVEKSINKLRGKMMMRRLPRINQGYYAGIYEFYKDDYEYDKKFLNRLISVTPDDLKRVAGQYLQTGNYVWIVVE